jgi:serine protease
MSSRKRTKPARKKAATKETAARKKRVTSKAAPTEPSALGLLYSVGRSIKDDTVALQLAERVVIQEFGEGWRVAPLGKGARDYRAAQRTGKKIPVGKAWELARKLTKNRDVFDAEPDLVGPGLEPHPDDLNDLAQVGPVPAGGPDGPPLACTNPPSYAWSLSLCKVQNAWALQPPDPAVGKGFGEGIVIGHPDTGYTQHAEIWASDPSVNRLLWSEGYNFFEHTNSPTDLLNGGNPGHGTGTSSVIMAGADFTQGDRVDGVAPKARLIPLRVTNTVIIWNFGHMAEAIHYAIEKKCHVVSISLGGLLKSRTLERAIQRAVENGVVVLCAAGNVWPWVIYPARFDEVIAVAACNCEKTIWRSSAAGPAVDVTAPGESVWVARTKRKGNVLDYYRDRGSGTSFAVATTAGACALWLAYHGRGTLIQKYGASNIASVFKELVMKSASTPTGWNSDKHGAGILDAEKLLQTPLPDTPHAAGMGIHANAIPAPATDMDDIAAFFPGVSRARVRSGLARFLNATESQLRELLAEYGDEILFHVASNPLVRAEIQRPPASPVAASPGMQARRGKQFERTASHAIKARARL